MKTLTVEKVGDKWVETITDEPFPQNEMARRVEKMAAENPGRIVCGVSINHPPTMHVDLLDNMSGADP